MPKTKAIPIGTNCDIIRDIRSGVENADVVRKYDLPKSTISTIMKDEKRLQELTNLSSDESNRNRLREATYKDVEEALFKWFLDARGKNIPISGPLLINRANEFAFLMGYQEFKPGGGWLQRFKERHGIVYQAIAGEGAAVDEDTANDWLSANVSDVFQLGERDIYNADETGLLYRMLPSKTHSLKGDKYVGGKNSKVHMTVSLCCNMDGSDRRLPFVVGKSEKLMCFQQFVPVRYRHNKKAWITQAPSCGRLKEFDDEYPSYP